MFRMPFASIIRNTINCREQPLVFVVSWDGINPIMDVKDGMHCNIPWPRCGGSLGGVR